MNWDDAIVWIFAHFGDIDAWENEPRRLPCWLYWSVAWGLVDALVLIRGLTYGESSGTLDPQRVVSALHQLAL